MVTEAGSDSITMVVNGGDGCGGVELERRRRRLRHR